MLFFRKPGLQLLEGMGKTSCDPAFDWYWTIVSPAFEIMTFFRWLRSKVTLPLVFHHFVIILNLLLIIVELLMTALVHYLTQLTNPKVINMRNTNLLLDYYIICIYIFFLWNHLPVFHFYGMPSPHFYDYDYYKIITCPDTDSLWPKHQK